MPQADPGADAVRDHYPGADERGRLDSPFGQVEFARTVELLERYLPSPPATVADIGGGPGRYSLWLAEHRYAVRHRDIVPLHVDQVRAEAAGRGLVVDAALGDARSLDLDDASADAVLLFGPLYHLPRRADRMRSLREAARVLRPGGPVLAVAISRWAPRMHGHVAERLYTDYPDIERQLETVEASGRLDPLEPGAFSGYCHRPSNLRREVREAGLEVIALESVEGIAFALPDLEARLADPRGREVVLEAASVLGSVPELLGIGPHLLVAARKPGSDPEHRS
jgi:SAM-dependent methyltransferase